MIFRVSLSFLLLLLLAAPPLPVGAAEMTATQRLYAQRCAKCHGKGGQGDGEGLQQLGTDVKPIDWTNKAAMAKVSDADMMKIIEVGGKGVGKSKEMPAFKGKLSEAEISDLIHYIRSVAK